MTQDNRKILGHPGDTQDNSPSRELLDSQLVHDGYTLRGLREARNSGWYISACRAISAALKRVNND